MTKKPRPKPLKVDRTEVEALIAFMREHGVHAMEFGGIYLELGPKQRTAPVGEPKSDPLPELTEEQKKKEEEEQLFWSAG